MCDMPVSSACGDARGRAEAQAVVGRAEVRSALEHPTRDVGEPLLRARGGEQVRALARVDRGVGEAEVPRRVEVGRPLPDVRDHVVEAIAVRRVRADRGPCRPHPGCRRGSVRARSSPGRCRPGTPRHPRRRGHRPLPHVPRTRARPRSAAASPPSRRRRPHPRTRCARPDAAADRRSRSRVRTAGARTPPAASATSCAIRADPSGPDVGVNTIAPRHQVRGVGSGEGRGIELALGDRHVFRSPRRIGRTARSSPHSDR